MIGRQFLRSRWPRRGRRIEPSWRLRRCDRLVAGRDGRPGRPAGRALGYSSGAKAGRVRRTSPSRPKKPNFNSRDRRWAGPNFYDTSFGGNLPVIPGLDLNGGAGYGWYDRGPRARTGALAAALTAFPSSER